MKKVFVDIYLAFNIGDDLFLDILAKRYPNCKFTINYVGKNYDKFISQYHNVDSREYTLLNKIGQRLNLVNYLFNYQKIAAEHDVLLFIGGSIFREEDYHASLYQERLSIIKAFRSQGKPVFIIGANFGPVKSSGFINDYRKLFRLCTDICFRDKYSYNLFKDIPQVRYAPDVVFQLELSDYKLISRQHKVGFSVIDLRHKHELLQYEKDYIGSTIKTIEYFANNGYECCLISFCEREGDLRTINTIMNNCSIQAIKRISVYNYQGNLKEAISLIATFKLFIAARFHANVLALLLDIGIMPVVYSEKITNMLGDINCNSILVGMRELHLQCDPNLLSRAFDNKLDLAAIATQAEGQFKLFDKLLKN